MNNKSLVKVALAVCTFAWASVASAAYVHCPGSGAHTLTSPNGAGYTGLTTTDAPDFTGLPSGYSSYIKSESFTNGVLCYYRAGNLDAGGPTGNGWVDFDNNGGPTLGGIKYTNGTWVDAGFTYNAATGLGSWTGLTGISYIGFHFGNGSSNPDSFIVQISGASGSFNFVNPTLTGLGLSNVYVFNSCVGEECEITEIPEPGSLALIGLGLAGIALLRRRRRS